jgi:hypothetical protein
MSRLLIEPVTPDEPGYIALKAESIARISTCCAGWKRTGSGVRTALTRRVKSCWAFLNGKLVGVCGLNRDPFSQQPRAGRIRHLYVSEKCAGWGLASSF